jgi:hypothetical protein
MGRGRAEDVPKASMASGMVLKAGCCLEVPFGCCCSEGAIAAVLSFSVGLSDTESVVCLYVEMRAVVASSVSLLSQVQIQIGRSNATKQASQSNVILELPLYSL